MLYFFDNSTENGQLYINYPMVESYKHLKKPLPDISFLKRNCNCGKLKRYKEVIGAESDFTHFSDLSRLVFKDIIIHHLCKACFMVSDIENISEKTAAEYWQKFDSHEILQIQNRVSAADNGFVYILCTCLFFILDYNSSLVFDGKTGFLQGT